MAPFCTRLPIQSCAPITRSGPVPAWEAVTNCACRSLDTVSTLTVTPLSCPNLAPIVFMAGPYRSSAQMVSAPAEPPAAPPLAAAPPLPADVAPPAAVVPPEPELEPQAVSTRAVTPISAAARPDFRRCMWGSSALPQGWEGI